ncbi:MAG: cation diffusion facilitator family transporter [Verrucomicrobiota bacterium]
MNTPRHPAQVEVARRADQGAALILRGVVLNLVLALVKLAGGLLGNTYALIADAVESFIDVITSLLVWAGFQVAKQPPDAEHPYGHGKAEPLAALFVSGVMILAAVWIAVHAVHEIRVPHAPPRAFTLPLLVGVVIVKLWFSRRLQKQGLDSGSTALAAESTHHGADALTSAAAFVGIVVALIGGDAYATADDWAALAASVVIGANGILVGVKALREIMDSTAHGELEQAVRALASDVEGVIAIEKCRVRKSGLSHLVDIHVIVDGEITVRAGHDIAHAVKDALTHSDRTITDALVHIEPAVARPD